ncbi:uncharacterized protein [Rutidosis leptorrhynchoides]|uniref:uncharacterized protein n=1 Tax=Rutidosis leptorrhynchoides TaxID=125765 RepID=UPI003A99CAB6
MASSKIYFFLALAFAVVLLITSEVVAAKDSTLDDRGRGEYNGGGRSGHDNGNGGGRGGYDNGSGHAGHDNGGGRGRGGYNNGSGHGGHDNGGGRGGYDNGGGHGGHDNGGGRGGHDNDGGRGGHDNGGSQQGGGGGGGHGGCRYGCCGGGRYNQRGGCKCCSTFAEATAYKQTQNQVYTDVIMMHGHRAIVHYVLLYIYMYYVCNNNWHDFFRKKYVLASSICSTPYQIKVKFQMKLLVLLELGVRLENSEHQPNLDEKSRAGLWIDSPLSPKEHINRAMSTYVRLVD